jgi:hypothetical protein
MTRRSHGECEQTKLCPNSPRASTRKPQLNQEHTRRLTQLKTCCEHGALTPGLQERCSGLITQDSNILKHKSQLEVCSGLGSFIQMLAQ